MLLKNIKRILTRSDGIETWIRRRVNHLARTKDKITGDDLKKLYRSVFSGQAGETVLDDLCRRFHINSSTFGPYDPPETADLVMKMREGERNAVNYILAMVYNPLEGKGE